MKEMTFISPPHFGHFKASMFQTFFRRTAHCFHCPFHESPGSCSLQCFDALKEVIVKNADTIAAVIVEPVCQGAVGMRIYPPEHTAELRRVCSECDVLMILDEIAVGFGRTVRMFASELAGVVPDMMCVEKGLTGGTLIPSLTK